MKAMGGDLEIIPADQKLRLSSTRVGGELDIVPSDKQKLNEFRLLLPCVVPAGEKRNA